MIDEPISFWQRPAEDLLQELQTTAAGLPATEASLRLARDGPNLVQTTHQWHVLRDLVRRLTNPLVAILLVAAAIAGATGDVASFIIIVAVILLSTALDMVQDYRAEATAEAEPRSFSPT